MSKASRTPTSLLALGLTIAAFVQPPDVSAQFKSRYANLPAVGGFGRGAANPTPVASQNRQAPAPSLARGVYPEFKTRAGQTVRWLQEQMPLQVWVSNGLAVDTIADPASKVPYVNVDQTGTWPDFIAYLIEHKKLGALPQAQGFLPAHRQAALEGFNQWKRFEKEGIFSFEYTNDPESADVHVFFTHHFVGKSGMALFAKDYKGLTSKRSFYRKDIDAGKEIPFKPVVVLLKTTDITDKVLTLPAMRAAAAHEFGHVLGIEEHSRSPGDLMSLYYGNGSISPRDADTIRYLYKLKPDLVP